MLFDIKLYWLMKEISLFLLYKLILFIFGVSINFLLFDDRIVFELLMFLKLFFVFKDLRLLAVLI